MLGLSIVSSGAMGQAPDTTIQLCPVHLKSSVYTTLAPAKPDSIKSRPVRISHNINIICYSYFRVINLDRPWNTTDQTYYSRDEFKEFGIHNFPNIWH